MNRSTVRVAGRSQRPFPQIVENPPADRRAEGSTYPEVFSRFLAAVRDDLVGHQGALIEGAKASPLYRRDMDEDVLAAAVGLNEAIALRRVEPFHRTCSHAVIS